MTNTFGYITEKDGRFFAKDIFMVAQLRGSNRIGELLTRQARNCIYSLFVLIL